MSKSVAQIESEIDVAVAAEPALVGLTSTSNTAIYRTWKKLMAVIHFLIYVQWDIYKQALIALGYSMICGTRAWYVQLAKSWVYLGSTIITRASCIESGTKVILKVAKNNGSGGTINLTGGELLAFKTYVADHKIAGTDLDILSQTADLIGLVLSIQFTGVQSTVQAAIIAALKNYLVNLPFDSSLSKSFLIDTLLQVPGVINAYVDELRVDTGLGYVVINGNTVNADAGYWEIGTDIGGDLIAINFYQ